MGFLYTKNRILRRHFFYYYRTVATQRLLIISLLVCFMVSSCSVFREAVNPKKTLKTKDAQSMAIADLSASGQMSIPVIGKVISPFGNGRGNHSHSGTDIKLHHGDTVRAAFNGVVIKSAPYSGYGNLVIIQHDNNIETYYGHLSKCLVKEGASVVAGEIIGLGGRTGRATTDHLHFEIRFNKIAQNAEHFFDFGNGVFKVPALGYASAIKIASEENDDSDSEQIESVHKKKNTKNAKSTKNTYSSHFVTIRKGDTLYALAKQYGTTVKQLQKVNRLDNPNLKLGMKLKLQ